MNCSDKQPHLIETARGRDLPSDERARVFSHAALCADCARRLEIETHLTNALADLALHSAGAPARLEQVIMRQLPVLVPRRKLSVGTWASLAAAALIATLALSTYRQSALSVTPLTETAPTQFASDGDFVALPYAQSLVPEDSTNIVRLQVSRESLLAVGLPVGLPASGNSLEDLIQADVVLGPDGTPRAIRMVD